MSNDNLSDNGVNEAGASSEGLSPGRSSLAQQGGSGRHHATREFTIRNVARYGNVWRSETSAVTFSLISDLRIEQP